VYLDSKYNEYFVSDEAYEQIVQLVQANKYCVHDYRNRHAYTENNPCVGRNICLEHLLQKQGHLTQIDVVGMTADNKSIYYFTDAKGYVYTSTEDSSDEAKQSTDETLTYYGFTPPATITSRGKSVAFYSYYATLHGDLHNASVIVLSYNQSSEKVRGLFLLYKGGLVKDFSKKSDLYHRADELVEATKDANGDYHINGRSHYGHYEADVYEVVSQLESALYDVTRKLQVNSKQEEEDDEEPLRKESDPANGI